MELTVIDEKEVLKDDKVTSDKISSIVGRGGDNRASMNASELKMEFEKIISELSSKLDVSLPNNQRCRGGSCQCSNELTSSESTGVVNPIQNLVSLCAASKDDPATESLGTSFKTSSLFNFSLNLRTSEILFEILKCQSRCSKNTDALGDFLFKFAATANPSNGIISASERWLLDSIERTVIARALMKSSSMLASQDKPVSNVSSWAVDTRQVKSSKLASYPPEFSDTGSDDPKFDLKTFGKQTLRSIITEDMLLSCSSSSSSHSHQSTSSAHHCVSMGILRCVQKGGIPYFEFSLDSDPGEVYVANPQKMDKSVDKTMDFIYLFLSKSYVKKGPKNQSNNSSAIAGKMKVTSSAVLSSNRSKSIETEFVLIGAHEDHSREMQGSPSTSAKSKGLSQMVSEIFRSKHLVKPKSAYKIGESTFEELLNERAMDHLAHAFPPNLELAAIVVQDNRPTRKEEVAGGGWGLRFLKKVEVSDTDIFADNETRRKDHTQSRNINVLVPAGYHSVPINGACGPSSLTQRWRSDGYCDCGGWDIGCPLTVLTSRSASSHTESEDSSKSVNLYIEGVDGEPYLRMVHVNESLYHIYFQSNIMPLQSFAIGVAIIHTQTPDLYPRL